MFKCCCCFFFFVVLFFFWGGGGLLCACDIWYLDINSFLHIAILNQPKPRKKIAIEMNVLIVSEWQFWLHADDMAQKTVVKNASNEVTVIRLHC